MSGLSFEAYDPGESNELAAWLASDTWPFHGTTSQTAPAYRQLILDGEIAGTNEQAFWIHTPDVPRSGLMRVLDLDDPTPLIDIRLRSDLRGKGIGRDAVAWLTDHVFETMADATRIEGHTRQDNLAMRRVFVVCGYAKEAHHRKAWPSEDGSLLDSIGYGITRDDWANGEVSPVPWDDE